MVVVFMRIAPPTCTRSQNLCANMSLMTRMGIVMSNKFRSVAYALFALGLMAEPASAIPGRIGQGVLSVLPSGGHLADGAITAAPRAFDVFCTDYVDQCASDGGNVVAGLDGARWNELQDVNSHVNRRIRAQADAYGTDVWTIGAREGDCDDYAVEKRRELIDRGWPTAALSLSVAFIRSGEAHLLLVVRTDRGDFALDNLRSRVVAADRTGYRWIARQSTIHPRLWVRIDGVIPDTLMVAKVEKSPAPASRPQKQPLVVAAVATMPSLVVASAPVKAGKAENQTVANALMNITPDWFDIEARIPKIDFDAIADLFDPITVGSIPTAEPSRVTSEGRLDL